MIHSLIRLVELIAVAATISSLVYYCFCLWSAAEFLRGSSQAGEGTRDAQKWPPVSILKPLKGTDPEMYESFRSHCLQNYPEFEITFGVSDPGDPACELVDRLKKEFPQKAIRLVFCRDNLGANTKVSNLIQMLPEARFDHLVVNDSDIRVEPDYLLRVLAPLTKPEVGLVTCLYRGVANDSLGSQLESLGISADFAPGVLVARQIEGIKFGLGSTLAFRRRDLEAIGGFQTLLDYLADDYQLGNRIASLGSKIELSKVVVETFLPHYDLRGFFDHQLRWARTVRDSRFWGYVGMGITFGIVWAIIALIVSAGSAWAWELLFATIAMRFVVAISVGKSVLHDHQLSQQLAWLPLRDFVAFAVWIMSFAGHTVSWRGDTFRLRDGKLARTGH
jgi:ceramide glucosyltransferase